MGLDDNWFGELEAFFNFASWDCVKDDNRFDFNSVLISFGITSSKRVEGVFRDTLGRESGVDSVGREGVEDILRGAAGREGNVKVESEIGWEDIDVLRGVVSRDGNVEMDSEIGWEDVEVELEIGWENIDVLRGVTGREDTIFGVDVVDRVDIFLWDIFN